MNIIKRVLEDSFSSATNDLQLHKNVLNLDIALSTFLIFNTVVMGYKVTYKVIDGKGIILDDGATQIGTFAFKGCTNLQSIVIPDSVTVIKWYAFFGCISLQSIAITTKEKDPDSSRERIEYLLQTLSKYSKEICLIVPIGRGYAYRHYPAFEGKFKKVIADIDA